MDEKKSKSENSDNRKKTNDSEGTVTIKLSREQAEKLIALIEKLQEQL